MVVILLEVLNANLEGIKIFIMPVLKEDCIDYLKTIDDLIDYKVTLVAIGGTALSLIDLKIETKDIDFLYQSPQEEFEGLCRRVAAERAYDLDIFSAFEVSYMNIPDWVERSEIYEDVGFRNITLRIWNFYDIILTKIDRFYETDDTDIETILKNNAISRETLQARFDYLFSIYMTSEEKGLFRKRYYGFLEEMGNLLQE